MPRGIYIRKRKDPWDLLWKHVDKNGPIPPFRPDLGPCWIWLGKRVTASGVLVTRTIVLPAPYIRFSMRS